MSDERQTKYLLDAEFDRLCCIKKLILTMESKDCISLFCKVDRLSNGSEGIQMGFVVTRELSNIKDRKEVLINLRRSFAQWA
jgi:hypothetical protein